MTTQPDIKAVLKSVNFLPLVERDIPALAGTYNEQRGYTKETACPKCGGKTRLRFRLCADGIQRVFCSHCAEQGLDAIAYLQWQKGISWRDAFNQVRELAGGHVTMTPAPGWSPAPVVDHPPSATWQTKARAFATACQDCLWSEQGRSALDYLRHRRLEDDTIRRAGLGYNPSMRQARGLGWGLSEHQTVTAVAGIVIPREVLGDVWAINVRRMVDGRPYKGVDKYICITGSKLGLWGADDLKGAQVAVSFGGEFDAILARQEAERRHLAGLAVVTFGGEGRTVTQPWRNMLDAVTAICVCLDNDAAGDAGAARWADVDMARRVRVPQGFKDLTEYAQAGGDVGDWLDDVTGTGPLTDSVLAWAEGRGYTVNLCANGHWQALKERDETVA